jgi:hypothetical protein
LAAFGCVGAGPQCGDEFVAFVDGVEHLGDVAGAEFVESDFAEVGMRYRLRCVV